MVQSKFVMSEAKTAPISTLTAACITMTACMMMGRTANKGRNMDVAPGKVISSRATKNSGHTLAALPPKTHSS